MVASGVANTLPAANTNHFVHIPSERAVVVLEVIVLPLLPIFEIVRPRHRLPYETLEIPAALRKRRKAVARRAGARRLRSMTFDEGAALYGFQVAEDSIQIASEISRLDKSGIRLACTELRVHGPDGRCAGTVARCVGLRKNAIIENLKDVTEFRALRPVGFARTAPQS
jgi:hypothetical protein